MTLAASGSAYSAPKTVLVVGDSLSAEYGITRGAGWVALLERKLKTEKIPAKVVNASISGETTIGGRTRLPGSSSPSRASSCSNWAPTTACAGCRWPRPRATCVPW